MRLKSYILRRGPEIFLMLGIPLTGFFLARPVWTPELAVRLGLFVLATVLWLFHAYSFNDWSNYRLDLRDPHKRRDGLAAEGIPQGQLLFFSFFSLAAGISLYLIFFPPAAALICLVLALLCVLYSSGFTLWKNIPVVSTSIHLVSGPLLFNLGWSVAAELSLWSWLAGLFFGLLYAAGHLSHESIDCEGDRAAGLRTTPVVFGLRRVFLLSALGVALATAYLALVARAGVVYPPALAAVYLAALAAYLFRFRRAWRTDLSRSALARFRRDYRAVYSLAGLLSLGLVVILPLLSAPLRPAVCLIGIDALDPIIFARLEAAGKLPHLGALAKRGVLGPLRSIPPLRSPALWTDIATGRRRESHGIVDFTVRNAEGKRVPAGADGRRGPALWNLVSYFGRTAGFVNWWPSYPAEKVDGFIVSNYLRYLYPELAGGEKPDPSVLEGLPGLAWPPELAGELLDSWPVEGEGFLAGLDLEAIKAAGFPGGYDPVFRRRHEDGYEVFRYAVLGDEAVLGLVRRLLRDRPVDLLGFYLEGLDVFCHLFWAYAHPDEFPVAPEAAAVLGGLIDAYYARLDAQVGELLRELPPGCAVIVVSDHGYGTVGAGRHFHLEDGLILLAGPGLRRGAKLSGAGLLEVAPTVLYLLGLPVPDEMESGPLLSAFEPRYLRSHPLKRLPGSVPEEGPSPAAPAAELDEKMMTKLRALGYLN